MLYPFLAIFVGALPAVQSRLNGQLSKDIHNGIAAAIISFGTGWIVLFILCFGLKEERAGLANIWKGVKSGRLARWEIIEGAGRDICSIAKIGPHSRFPKYESNPHETESLKIFAYLPL